MLMPPLVIFTRAHLIAWQLPSSPNKWNSAGNNQRQDNPDSYGNKDYRYSFCGYVTAFARCSAAPNVWGSDCETLSNGLVQLT